MLNVDIGTIVRLSKIPPVPPGSLYGFPDSLLGSEGEVILTYPKESLFQAKFDWGTIILSEEFVEIVRSTKTDEPPVMPAIAGLSKRSLGYVNWRLSCWVVRPVAHDVISIDDWVVRPNSQGFVSIDIKTGDLIPWPPAPEYYQAFHQFAANFFADASDVLLIGVYPIVARQDGKT